jgi:hypothetical protein
MKKITTLFAALLALSCAHVTPVWNGIVNCAEQATHEASLGILDDVESALVCDAGSGVGGTAGLRAGGTRRSRQAVHAGCGRLRRPGDREPSQRKGAADRRPARRDEGRASSRVAGEAAGPVPMRRGVLVALAWLAVIAGGGLAFNCAHDGSNNVPPIPPEPDPIAVPMMRAHDGGAG